MSAAEFTAKIDAPGSHDHTGVVIDGERRYFCDIMAERSDVSVTTKAVEWAMTKFRTASSSEARVGYLVVVGSDEQAPAVYLNTINRPLVRELHDEVVRACREHGTDAAITGLQDLAFIRGVTTRYLGTLTAGATAAH